MIKLRKLLIDSYRLYENAELDFTQLSGLITLLGRNDDIENFSSNSVGKSTMIDSILTVLFGKNLLGTALENNINLYTGKKPSITLEFELDEIVYTIINDYNINVLKVYKNGSPIEAIKKKDTFEYIEKTLGLSHFLLKHLIYLSPSSNSIFSESDATLQGKFIQQLLNLEFISDVNKKVSNDLKGVKADLQLKIKELDLLHNNLDTLNKQLTILPDIEDIDYQPDINRLSGEQYEVDLLIKSQEKVLVKLNKEFDILKTKATELKTEKRLLETEIKRKLDLSINGICPTCGNDTHNIQVDEDKVELEQLQWNLDNINTQGFDKKAEILEIETDIKGLKNKKDIIKAELDLVIRKKEALVATEAQKGARLVLQAQLEDILTKMIALQSEVGELEDEKYMLELINQCSSAKGFVKERIELFLHLYNIELKQLSKELLGAGHSIKIIKDDSNKYYLEVNDGDITLSYNMLSSGFKSRIDVLLILALNKTVETLTGISINVLILDEILSAVDTQGVEAMQELLLQIQHKFPEKLVFVVSHNQALRFDNTLTIHRSNNSSKFIING